MITARSGPGRSLPVASKYRALVAQYICCSGLLSSHNNRARPQQAVNIRRRLFFCLPCWSAVGSPSGLSLMSQLPNTEAAQAYRSVQCKNASALCADALIFPRNWLENTGPKALRSQQGRRGSHVTFVTTGPMCLCSIPSLSCVSPCHLAAMFQ